MKKILITTCIFLLCLHTVFVNAQQQPLVMPSLVKPDGNPKNLYEYKTEMEGYFNQLAASQGQGVFTDEAGDYSQYRRWLSYWEPRLSPGGSFEAYYASLRDAYEEQPVSGGDSRANTDPWNELGPKRRPEQGGQVGIGPTHFVTINRTNPNMMLTGAFESGLFYSPDGGENWVNAGSDTKWTISACGWAEFSPANVNVWYASNTCRNVWGPQPFLGYNNGIWRTTDAGNTWEMIGDQSNFDGVWTRINSFRVDPSNANVMYVATTAGIFKTSNLNDPVPAWTKIYPSSGYANIYDLEIKYSASNVIYASAQNGTTWSVIQSLNSGSTWAAIPSQPAAPSNTANYTIELTEANTDYVYVIQSLTTSAATLFRYNASSGIWSTQSTGLSISMGGGHGFGVSNVDPEMVFVSHGIGYRRSINGGTSWTSHSVTHVDVEDIYSPPASCTGCSNQVWMCNHGGISKSTNNGVNWTDKSEGLGVAQGFGFSGSETDPDAIALGLYHDNSALTKSTYAPGWMPQWGTYSSGDGQIPHVDYNNGDNVWLAPQYGPPYEFSTAWGNPFTSTNAEGGWYTFIEQNSADPALVYGKRTTSVDARDLYRIPSYGLGTPQAITDFNNFAPSYADSCWPLYWRSAPSDPNVIYCVMQQHMVGPDGITNKGGFVNTHLLRTTVAQSSAPTVIASWYDLYIPRNSWITDFCIDPYNANVVYLAYSGYQTDITTPSGGMVYRIDYTNPLAAVTQNWSHNLVAQGVVGITCEKGSNGGVYIVSERGVQFSNNQTRLTPATAWRLLGNNIPQIGGTQHGLSINYTINKIRTSLYGRGVWEHDLYCPDDDDLVYASPDHTSSIFAEARNTITSTATVHNGQNVTYRAGQYVHIQPGFITQAGAVFHAFIHPCDDNGNTYHLAEDVSMPGKFDDTGKGVRLVDMPFNLYPNPAEGRFTIEKKTEEDALIDVYDLFGRSVITARPVTQNKTEIDFSGQPVGIYLVRITTAGKTETIRLIKQ